MIRIKITRAVLRSVHLVLFLVCLAVSQAEAQKKNPIQPRIKPLSSAGLWVPVPLDLYASDSQGFEFPARHIQVGNVPFDLVLKDGADNFFLKSAEWPKWKDDPSRYYADYDSGPETPGDPRRPFFKIPVTDYQAVYLLAAAEDDEAFSQAVSFRIGAFDGPRRTTIHDFETEVPRFSGRRNAVTPVEIPMKGGKKLFLVRVPLGKAIAQDFIDEWALDVEVTKKLRLQIRRPDPCRYQIRPLGLPSGVHIFGMTFQRSPIQMEVTSDESGHVLNEPQTPTFHVRLTNVERRTHPVSVIAEATDYYGNTITMKSPKIELRARKSFTQDIKIPGTKRGWHKLVVRVKRSERVEYLRRETSFAMLTADTRRFRERSPFGTWDFCGGHFTSSDCDAVGPLYVKAGLRYGMFSFPAAARRKYGILAGNEPRSAEILAKKLADDPLFPKRVLIFHENAVSGPHIMRTPDIFTGRPQYQFDEKEQANFDKLWELAHTTAQEVHDQFPDAKLMFGNGNPHLVEAFLRRKFPSELFDARGNEAGVFMRMPETQPFDFVANNAGMWMDRQILNHYGYEDKPIWQCYEITYPGSNPGNLSQRTQAAYFVRHAMHSLAWGIPVIRQGIISDVGNSYYYSNWGSSGFCNSIPELNPKPAYVAIATMTQQLDGATFTRVIETESPTTFAVEFKKPGPGGFVTVMWTLRGSREVAISPDDLEVVDVMGNPHPVTSFENRANLTLTPEPIFVSSKKAIQDIGPGSVGLEGRPKGGKLLSKMDKVTDWKIQTERDPVLENYNFENPRLKGDLELEGMAEFEGETNVLKVTPRLTASENKYLPYYTALEHVSGIEVLEKPTEIGLMVNGNGGWGRIIFEFTDAEGQTWTSIGAAQSGDLPHWMNDWMSKEDIERMGDLQIGDWNTNDCWQRSRINFEGWRYLRFPMPGNYPGEGYHWPYSSQWRHTGDGIVHYPIKFTRLIVETPQKVLRMKEFKPVARPEIYLMDLMVTYRPPEEAFVAE